MSKILYPAQRKYLEFHRKKEDKLIVEMEDFAEKHHVPILDWHSVEFVENLILAHKPDRVLEIGTAIAYTTIRIARCLDKNSRIHSIEKSTDNIKLALENIEKSGLDKKIKLIQGDALSIMPQMKKKYDFIFLDADKEDYKKKIINLIKIIGQDELVKRTGGKNKTIVFQKINTCTLESDSMREK